jgi:hypothetical protein
MIPDRPIMSSKKARVLGIALLNLNIIFFFSVFNAVDTGVVTQMITAILFLSGLYVGVQGGIDMIQSNRTTFTKEDATITNVEKKYEYRMEYVDDK